MIRIGLSEAQKQDEIKKYVTEHGVRSVIVFSPKKFFMGLPALGDVSIRQIEYNEVIMYRTFYPLLEEIGPDHLLVVNEFVRTKNRNDLTFNCLRHYLNQCGHQMVFEYFPFINDASEFMIPFDFDTKSKYKGNGFSPDMLQEADVQCINHHITMATQMVNLPEGADEEYVKKRDTLFDSIGKKDPDTVPRELHLFCGRWKKPFITDDALYVARNSRYKLPNVITYPKVKPGETYTLLDFMHRRMDMNDFLRRTGQAQLVFLSTGLSVDNYYVREFDAWLERLEDFYAQTGIYSGNC